MENENVKGLKGLKSLLAGELQSISDNIRNSVINAPKQYGLVGFSPTPVQSSAGNFGESIFDPKIANADQFLDINNARGENQPWYAQLGAGVGKMGVLAGTTFLNSTVGLVAGVGTAIAEGRWSGIWDNGVNKYLNNINKESEKFLPNYYTNEEKDSPWYTLIFTSNFLGDKLLKNMGFTMGAIAAGALTGNFGTNFLAGAGKIGSMASKALATTVSAAGEASIEALNASQDFMTMNQLNIDKTIGTEKLSIDGKYANYMAQLDAKYVKGGNTFKKLLEQNALHTQYSIELKNLQDRREALLVEAIEDKLKVGNTTFALNQALLGVTNNLQFGRELAGGFKNVKRAKALITSSIATGEKITGAKAIGEALLKSDLKVEANKGMEKAITRNILLRGASEGFEEGAQDIASNASQIRYSAALNTFAGAKVNPYVQDNVNDLLSAAGQAITDQFSTPESPGWQNVALGFGAGLIGVPFLKKGKGGLRATWAGGITEGIEAAKEEFRANKVVDKVNENIQKPAFINRYQGLARHQTYQQRMDAALNTDNEYEYANNEASQLISDVLMFNEAGALDGFKAFNNSFRQEGELSDEQVKDLKDNTTGETGKSIYDGLNKTQIKDIINENVTKTNKIIDNVTKVHDEHLIRYSDTFNKEELEELTWLRVKALDWHNDAITKYEELQKTLRPVLEQLDTEDIKDEEGNIIRLSDLLNRTPQQFVLEMKMPDATLTKALWKVLDSKNGEFNNLTKESRDVHSDLAQTQSEGNKKKANKLVKQLDAVMTKLDELQKSGTVLDAKDFESQLNHVVAPVVASITFTTKYLDAIQDPASLSKRIQEEKDKATIEQTKVITKKNVDKLRVATNLALLKKNGVGMTFLERQQALNELGKEDTFVGKLALELSNMDHIHKALGNILDSGEFTDLSEEEKIATRNTIDEAYKTSEKNSDMISKLETQAVVNPTLASLMEIKKNSDAEKASYKNETKEAIPTPIKPTVNKEEIDLDSTPTPTQTSNEITPQKVIDSVDASFLNEEDYIKMMAATGMPLSEVEIQDVLDNSQKYIDIVRNQYKDIDANTIAGTLGAISANFVNYFKDAKERNAVAKANNSDKDNPETFEELGKALEEVAEILDKTNKNKTGEIRSDAVSEADIELLMPKGQGMSGRGKRFFKSLFSGSETLAGKYDHIWNYLLTSGAFDFINSGKLADLRDKNEHTKIHFIVDKTLNSYVREDVTPLSNIILMAVEANTPTSTNINGTQYQIVGTLKANTEYISSLQTKILSLSTLSTEDKFVSPDYSEIDFIYPGRIATSKVGQDEAERDVVSNGKQLFFGIFKKERIFSPNVPEGKAVEPTTEDNKEGRVYLMIKAADGKYYPTPVRRKMFTELDYPQAAYGETPVYKTIMDSLDTLSNPMATEDNRYFARDMFEKFIYFGNKVQSLRAGSGIFQLRWLKDKLTGRQWIQISRETGEEDADGKKVYQTVQKDGKNYTVALTNDLAANKQALLDLVLYMEPMFQINSKLLENNEYVDMLVASGVFTTNLADYTLHNAMFTIKPMDNNGKPVQTETPTEKPLGAKKNAVGSADVFESILDKNGKEYKLYPSGDILDSEGLKVTKPMTKAFVYATDAFNKGTALNKNQYGEHTLYTMSMDNAEYGVLTNKDGKITNIYLGEEYQLAVKYFAKTVADAALAKAIAEALTNNGETSVEDLKANGYNPNNYIIEIVGGSEGYRGLIYSKTTGDRVITIVIPMTSNNNMMEEMQKLTSSYTEEELDNMELMNPIIAPVINKVLKNYFGENNSRNGWLDTLNSISANQNPLIDNKGIVTATNMKDVIWDKTNTKGINSKEKAIELMKKFIKKKYSEVVETKVVTPKPEVIKEKTNTETTSPLINALGNNLQNENNLPKDLHISKEITIFANHSVEELSKLRAALKSKGVSSKTASQIAQATMDLLGMSETELLALDTDAIIGKINCK